MRGRHQAQPDPKPWFVAHHVRWREKAPRTKRGAPRHHSCGAPVEPQIERGVLPICQAIQNRPLTRGFSGADGI
jgi:hypothetical protein